MKLYDIKKLKFKYYSIEHCEYFVCDLEEHWKYQNIYKPFYFVFVGQVC